ncbi:MAG: hypothetical protein N2738_09245 [Thermodesulfovibrionales bacterium]|nr:hypothetical protein [Thermodesulfovibrionales bacterium]
MLIDINNTSPQRHREILGFEGSRCQGFEGSRMNHRDSEAQRDYLRVRGVKGSRGKDKPQRHRD